jgi:asparagine synthase (glutamine-hydrolysing)
VTISEVDKVGVAFSGGVDSSILAMICRNLNKQVTLLTVGFPESHDISFSRMIASKMGMEHKLYEIGHVDFEENVRHVLREIECKNISHIENCLGYIYICRIAKENNLNLVLSANGCDELFYGYDVYRRLYDSGEAELNRVMGDKIDNELALIDDIEITIARSGIQIRQPFLSSRFIQFAKSIQFGHKILGPNDMLRKHVLRWTALEIGVPIESAMKPKKALQYGSSIHKYFKKIDRKNKNIVSSLMEDGSHRIGNESPHRKEDKLD